MRVLLTGASGFLGRRLAAALAARHQVTGTYLSEDLPIPGCAMLRLDVTDADEVRRAFSDLRPELVVHAAAVANPERCEQQPDLARSVNVDGTAVVSQAAQENGARLFYISTDLIFDGRNAPYREGDEPRPLSLYARTKLEGEALAQASCRDTLILRLSLCYGWKETGAPTFTDWLYRTLSEGKKAKLFTDQFRAALWMGDAARMMALLADKPRRAPFSRGILHMAGPESVSRCRFGEILCDVFGFPRGLIEPISMADMPLPAPRPRDCSLDGTRLCALLGFKPKSVAEGLACLREELARAPASNS